MKTDFIRQPREWRLIARHSRPIARFSASLLLLISCHSDQTGPGPLAALHVESTSLEWLERKAISREALLDLWTRALFSVSTPA